MSEYRYVCPVCSSVVVMYVPAKEAWCSEDPNGFEHPSAQMVRKK